MRERMCIVCRNRFFQGDLNRFQCINNEIVNFTGKGRSFYICDNCLSDKKLIKRVAFICKVNKNRAKEIVSKLIELK